MNAFANAFLEEENYTTTANGANTFKSSFNANLDFFGQAGAMRGQESEFLELFRLAWQENPKLALQNLFYMRDIRNGVGERDLFIKCFGYIADKLSDDDFSKVLPFIPEYGRWSDVFDIMIEADEDKFAVMCDFLHSQILMDINGMENNKPISLLAKWFPLANNRHNVRDITFAHKVANSLFGNDKKCRKTIVSLRRYINVLEQKISTGKWDEVNYETVPSLANMKYRKAFLRNDEARYSKYLDDVKNGEKKINSSVTYPYDIVRKIIDRYSYYNVKYCNIDKEERKLLDNLWINLPDYTNGNSSIAVVDVSGSMFSGYGKNSPIPISVSVSLGIYFAERNKSAFKDMFITFSNDPKFCKVRGNDIVSKVQKIMDDDNVGYNTNLLGVYKAYIKLAKKCNSEDCPKSIIMISDMEFDCALNEYDEENSTNYEEIDKMFRDAGIEKPNLIFWNVNSSGKNCPVTKDEHGTIMISGYSPAIFKFICNEKTNPEDFMLDVLSNYDKIVENL